MKIFDYSLPKELIAQYPLRQREKARLMVVNREKGTITHDTFQNIDSYFKEEVLVLNDTKVIPARIKCIKDTGGKLEIFLLKKIDEFKWEVLIRGKIHPGRRFFKNGLEGEILNKTEKGSFIVSFNISEGDLKKYGEVPLPPYIKRKPAEEDEYYYQTVYAKKEGAVAAPTAGLHFTEGILKKLKKKGVKIVSITLHIGWASFKIVNGKEGIGEEFFEVGEGVGTIINESKKNGKKIVAVGTSCVRCLESCVENGKIIPKKGYTDLFITPGFEFKIVDRLITNFHLPGSTHLYLVCAFGGTELIEKAYKLAIEERYRFYSYGDSMIIL